MRNWAAPLAVLAGVAAAQLWSSTSTPTDRRPWLGQDSPTSSIRPLPTVQPGAPPLTGSVTAGGPGGSAFYRLDLTLQYSVNITLYSTFGDADLYISFLDRNYGEVDTRSGLLSQNGPGIVDWALIRLVTQVSESYPMGSSFTQFAPVQVEVRGFQPSSFALNASYVISDFNGRNAPQPLCSRGDQSGELRLGSPQAGCMFSGAAGQMALLTAQAAVTGDPVSVTLRLRSYPPDSGGGSGGGGGNTTNSSSSAGGANATNSSAVAGSSDDDGSGGIITSDDDVSGGIITSDDDGSGGIITSDDDGSVILSSDDDVGSAGLPSLGDAPPDVQLFISVYQPFTWDSFDPGSLVPRDGAFTWSANSSGNSSIGNGSSSVLLLGSSPPPFDGLVPLYLLLVSVTGVPFDYSISYSVDARAAGLLLPSHSASASATPSSSSSARTMSPLASNTGSVSPSVNGVNGSASRTPTRALGAPGGAGGGLLGDPAAIAGVALGGGVAAGVLLFAVALVLRQRRMRELAYGAGIGGGGGKARRGSGWGGGAGLRRGDFETVVSNPMLGGPLNVGRHYSGTSPGSTAGGPGSTAGGPSYTAGGPGSTAGGNCLVGGPAPFAGASAGLVVTVAPYPGAAPRGPEDTAASFPAAQPRTHDYTSLIRVLGASTGLQLEQQQQQEHAGGRAVVSSAQRVRVPRAAPTPVPHDAVGVSSAGAASLLATTGPAPVASLGEASPPSAALATALPAAAVSSPLLPVSAIPASAMLSYPIAGDALRSPAAVASSSGVTELEAGAIAAAPALGATFPSSYAAALPAGDEAADAGHGHPAATLRASAGMPASPATPPVAPPVSSVHAPPIAADSHLPIAADSHPPIALDPLFGALMGSLAAAALPLLPPADADPDPSDALDPDPV